MHSMVLSAGSGKALLGPDGTPIEKEKATLEEYEQALQILVMKGEAILALPQGVKIKVKLPDGTFAVIVKMLQEL